MLKAGSGLLMVIKHKIEERSIKSGILITGLALAVTPEKQEGENSIGRERVLKRYYEKIRRRAIPNVARKSGKEKEYLRMKMAKIRNKIDRMKAKERSKMMQHPKGVKKKKQKENRL